MNGNYYSLTREQKIGNLKLTEENLRKKINSLQNQLEGVQRKLQKLESSDPKQA